MARKAAVGPTLLFLSSAIAAALSVFRFLLALLGRKVASANGFQPKR
ncbi:hypothetical protein IB270_07660 [Ensifer sp. ENS05]|nr:hypothetical protein [Ensifer sp. ENS05]MBD9592705.1 hypothetical protein [Ensifer sp. ENS05]